MQNQTKEDFIKKESAAIYEEFNNYLTQMIMLKPFLKNLVDVANGEVSKYALNDIINHEK